MSIDVLDYSFSKSKSSQQTTNAKVLSLKLRFYLLSFILSSRFSSLLLFLSSSSISLSYFLIWHLNFPALTISLVLNVLSVKRKKKNSIYYFSNVLFVIFTFYMSSPSVHLLMLTFFFRCQNWFFSELYTAKSAIRFVPSLCWADWF